MIVMYQVNKCMLLFHAEIQSANHVAADSDGAGASLSGCCCLMGWYE